MFLCFLNWWNQSFDISQNWTQFIIRIWPVYTTRAAAQYYRPPLSNYLKPQIGVKKSTCLHTSNLDPDHLCLKLTFFRRNVFGIYSKILTISKTYLASNFYWKILWKKVLDQWSIQGVHSLSNVLLEDKNSNRTCTIIMIQTNKPIA